MRIKRLALLFFLFCWPLSAFAATLVCDPQPGVQYYLIDGLPIIAATEPIPAQADGSIAFVIDSLPLVAIKVYTIKAKACVLEECSEWSVPFVFAWPSPRPWENPRIRK